MKRILIALLAILLALCFTACELDIEGLLGGSSSSSSKKDNDDEDYEQEDDEDDDDEDNATPSSSTKKETKPDTTVYSNTIDEQGKWVYGDFALKAPEFYGYYNGYSSALSMTFDDGYDTSTGRYVTELFKQYGFKGTMMLGPCFLNEDLVKEWNDILDEGYLDVGCHGYSHKEPTTLPESEYEHEIKDAIDYLREAFPSQRVLTFATPYAHINDSYEAYLKNHVISNRLEASGTTVKIGESNNLYRVKSISMLKNTDPVSFGNNIAKLISQPGTWTVLLAHCVLDNPSNNTDTSKSTLSSFCQFLDYSYSDKVWVTSFEEVSIYVKQVESAKINYIASDRESMTISVSSDLDKTIYNIPMTIKLQIPYNITSAYAVIGDKVQMLNVTKGSGVNSIVVKDIPLTGENVKIYFGGNDIYSNGCDHRYEKISTTTPTCTQMGVAVYECWRCGASYKGDFKAIKDHDFSGERVTVTAPSATENGLDKIKCKNCDTYKEIVTKYANVATATKTRTTDGVNQWVYVEDMFDGNTSTGWTNGTDVVDIIALFDTASIEYVEVIYERYSSQTLTILVYDGENWTPLENLTSEESGGKVTVRCEVNERIKGVQLKFTSSIGCTKVCEFVVYGIEDVQ